MNFSGVLLNFIPSRQHAVFMYLQTLLRCYWISSTLVIIQFSYTYALTISSSILMVIESPDSRPTNDSAAYDYWYIHFMNSFDRHPSHSHRHRNVRACICCLVGKYYTMQTSLSLKDRLATVVLCCIIASTA